MLMITTSNSSASTNSNSYINFTLSPQYRWGILVLPSTINTGTDESTKITVDLFQYYLVQLTPDKIIKNFTHFQQLTCYFQANLLKFCRRLLVLKFY